MMLTMCASYLHLQAGQSELWKESTHSVATPGCICISALHAMPGILGQLARQLAKDHTARM